MVPFLPWPSLSCYLWQSFLVDASPAGTWTGTERKWQRRRRETHSPLLSSRHDIFLRCPEGLPWGELTPRPTETAGGPRWPPWPQWRQKKKCNNLPFWTEVLFGVGHLESRTRWCGSHHRHPAHCLPSPPLPSIIPFPPSGESPGSCAFPQSRGTCPGFFPTWGTCCHTGMWPHSTPISWASAFLISTVDWPTLIAPLWHPAGTLLKVAPSGRACKRIQWGNRGASSCKHHLLFHFLILLFEETPAAARLCR